MAKIIDDQFMVCSDCLQPIVNDDWSSFDYYYTEEEAEKRMANVFKGIGDAGGYIVYDGTEDCEFSNQTCDCCGCMLAGARHHCVVFGDAYVTS